MNVSRNSRNKQLASLFEELADQGRLHGSVLVARQGEVLFSEGFGFADVERGVENRASTVYKIGSLTKAFVSLVVLQLQECGLLNLEDPVSRYIPGFPGGDVMTIHNLMSHTAGVWCYLQEPDSPLWSSMGLAHNPQWLLEVIWGRPAQFLPGSQWRYSNSGYVLLGLIIERVTGEALGSILRREVFDPLGMDSTAFDLTETMLREDLAVGYLDPSPQRAVIAPNLHASVTYASGAMMSTVEDMFLWDRAVYHRRLVSKSSWATLTRPVRANYACGWWADQLETAEQCRPVLWHWGVCYGYHGMIARLLKEDITFIVLQNVISPDLEDPAAPRALLDLLARTIEVLCA